MAASDFESHISHIVLIYKRRYIELKSTSEYIKLLWTKIYLCWTFDLFFEGHGCRLASNRIKLEFRRFVIYKNIDSLLKKKLPCTYTEKLFHNALPYYHGQFNLFLLPHVSHKFSFLCVFMMLLIMLKRYLSIANMGFCWVQ